MECVRRCWFRSRAQLSLANAEMRSRNFARIDSRPSSLKQNSVKLDGSRPPSLSLHGSRPSSLSLRTKDMGMEAPLQIEAPEPSPQSNANTAGRGNFSPPTKSPSFWNLPIFGGDGTTSVRAPSGKVTSPLSPRRRKAMERSKMIKRVTNFVSSPFPYVVLLLLFAMIVMIFVDIMPISGLICVFAILMVVIVVLGNHWRNRQVWIEASEVGTGTNEVSYTVAEDGTQPLEEDLGPMTTEDKLDNLNHFFEALFNSIDYSLLIIFLGLFVVIGNLDSTGIPKYIWAKIVGGAPFQTASSITGICIFVLLSSQFLGNVAVVQLAKPNVQDLDDAHKRLAWAVISFVATVGGNLTITGSAGTYITFYVLCFDLLLCLFHCNLTYYPEPYNLYLTNRISINQQISLWPKKLLVWMRP